MSHTAKTCVTKSHGGPSYSLLSTAIGVDYVVVGFDMEAQPLVTDNAS